MAHAHEQCNGIIFATGGYDHTIKFWLPHNGQCSRIIQHPNSQVNDLKISPCRSYLAAAGFQHIRLFNASTGNPDITLEGFNKNVLTIGFQEDTKWLFSGGEDFTTRVWDLRSKTHQSQKSHQSSSAVNSARLHSNQVEIFIGEQSGSITVWDLRKESSTLAHVEQDPLQSITLSSDGQLLAAIENTGHCNLYSVTAEHTLSKLKRWTAHDKYGLKCLFSSGSKYLVTTSADHTAKIWLTEEFFNSDEPTPSAILAENNQRWVWDATFSADSKYVFTASSDNISRLWNVETGALKREYVGHQKAVTAIAFAD
ncbi:Target of rapamycin complex subunit LST8, partial [Fragariocoptes setiger]